MSVEHPTLEMDKEFIRHYHDCELFKTFLFPLMQSEPVQLLNELFLVQIYEYLHQSCKAIESILQTEDPNIPVHSNIDSWYEMSDRQVINTKLLLSFRDIFELEYIKKQG